VIKEHKNYATAQATKYLVRGPRSKESLCNFFPRCGGCQWLDIESEKQKEWKLKFVEDALGDVLKGATWLFVPSPSNLGYRERIQIKGEHTPGKPLRAGFYQANSHDIVPIEHCAVSHPRLNLILAKLHAETLQGSRPFKFTIEIQGGIDHSGLAKALLTLDSEKGTGVLKELKDRLAHYPDVAWCEVHDASRGNQYFLYDQQLGIDFCLTPTSFQQVNLAANQLLRKAIYERTQTLEPNRILDLYCGSGNLSLALARETDHVTGVEEHPNSIKCGHYNLEQNRLTNYEFIQAPAKRYLEGVYLKESFDLLIVDPPRKGIKNEVPLICKKPPKTIFYISCDPMTFGRDLKQFVAAGYRLTELTTYDFFPHTYHVENFGILTRE
jgi:23S rRNA (uracil1939-C5)-methyltransferase